MSATLAGLKSQVMGYMEELESELIALRCVTGLLNGQTPGSNAIQLSELSYIIDPIIEREKEIMDNVVELFNGVGINEK